MFTAWSEIKYLATSVTRFGEFPPFWVTIIVLEPFRKCTISIWQIFELILAIFFAIEQILIVVNGQI